VPRIYAEVKGFRELEDLDRMVLLARNAGMLSDVLFISMNWTLLDRMRGQEPGLSVGYIVDEVNKVEEAVQRATGDPASLVDFRADLLTSDPSLARRCLDLGIELAVWTVNDAAEASRLLGLGVRRVTTNEVEALLAWKASI
jgi:glycerophosphoryl diester phosphodiesterase